MNKEKLISIAKFVFEPLYPIIAIVAGCLLLAALLYGFAGILYALTGGLLLCSYYEWPIWIGFVWFIVVFWIISKIGIMIYKKLEIDW